MPRSVPQPRQQLVDCGIITAGANLYPAVRQVYSVTVQIQRHGYVTGSGAEKHALHPAADFELTAHRQRGSVSAEFSALARASSAFSFACTASVRASL